MKYALQAVPGFELPAELLEQKRDYDVEGFFRAALQNPERVYAYIIRRGDEEVSCFWAHLSPLYKSLHVDTFVVDEKVRNDDLVRDCLRIAFATCEGLAMELGAEKLAWSSPPKMADRMMKFIDDDRLQVKEWVLAIDVPKAEVEAEVVEEDPPG